MLFSPLIAALRRQADWCRGASPFTARRLDRGAVWLAAAAGVWQYLGAVEQAAITAGVEAAAAQARPAAPLAWLRLEPPDADSAVALRCRLRPGGDDRLLATAHPHRAWVAGCAP